MADLLWEDQDAFLQLQADGDFAIQAVYKGSTTVQVIFDEETQVLDPGTTAIRDAGPMVTGKESDFPAIAVKDSLLIGFTTYFVKSWLKDGTGFIEIFLTLR